MKTFREFITECELIEGKVEWDNPKRPLQSGLTPREKNRAKRISTGVENPDKSPSEKSLERYGKLKIAHDDEKDKKVPSGKKHKFGLFKVGPFTSVAPKGELKRQEMKKGNKLKDLKEPKESFDYSIGEGIQPLPREKMLGQIVKKSGAAHSANVFRKDYKKRGLEDLEGKQREKVAKKASQIKKMKSKLKTHDPLDRRFRELENRDRGEKK